MPQIENNKNSKGLDKESIKKIVDQFNFIDQKILDLHEYSSQDFLNLNKILKDYFHKIKSLTENSTSIIDSISGKCFKEFTNKLNNLQNDLNSPMLAMEETINQRIVSMEKILKILDYIYVPLNNLKQNLMTLKLVLASVKLNNNLFKEESTKIEDYAKITDILNVKIKELYSILENNLKDLKSEIKDALFQQYHIKDKTIAEVNTIKFNIQSSINLISEKYTEIFSEIPQITEQAQLCFKNIDQIITNLQYHDIIRQKLTHIQEIQKDIIEDLNQYDVHGDIFKAKYLNNIPHIAELQVAQLMLTNKEYQNAIEKITTELLEINDKIQTITNISLKISDECMQSRKSNEADIEKKEKQFIKALENASKETSDFQTNIAALNSNNKDLLSLFSKISEFELDLSKFNSFLNEQNDKSDKFSQLTEKTNTILNDITNNNKEIQKLSGQINEHIDLLDKHNNNLSSNNIDTILTSGKDLFDALVKNIRDYTNDIGKQLLGNIDLSNKISEDIKASIKNIKYYELFEKIIEVIIHKLNLINQILRDRNMIVTETDEVKDLNKLKEKYTMQSERDIHDQIVNKEKELGIAKDEKEDDEQGDLELF